MALPKPGSPADAGVGGPSAAGREKIGFPLTRPGSGESDQPYMDADGTLHNLRPIGRLETSGPDTEPRRYADTAFGGGWFVSKAGAKTAEDGTAGAGTNGAAASAGGPGGRHASADPANQTSGNADQADGSAGQAGAGQASAGQAGAGQASAGQAGTGRAGAGQAGADRAGAGQAGADQAGGDAGRTSGDGDGGGRSGDVAGEGSAALADGAASTGLGASGAEASAGSRPGSTAGDDQVGGTARPEGNGRQGAGQDGNGAQSGNGRQAAARDVPRGPELAPHLPLTAAELSAIRWRLDGATLREVVDNRDALRALGERLDGPLTDEADNIVKAGLLSVRAEVYRLLGELGMAAAASRLALAHAESAQDLQSMVIAQAELAHVLRLRGDYMEADRLFERALEAEVSPAVRSVVHENAGRSCFDQGRHMEALDHFARAIRLGAPEDTDLVERIGVCLEAVYIHVLRDGWGPYPRRSPEILAPLGGRPDADGDQAAQPGQ
ncbi:hypothetical protein SAMN05421541_103285 [Actinoplanes philippinensis]|uniref:Uncharacterized protein n=1 Tax=Actinoplanes philippinensis TaxID=35752 RepID=A0A1I2CYE9_9ACTN|nr:hypothetical protein SAMN05421541_103285 [Actinoplanes philippinensis]